MLTVIVTCCLILLGVYATYKYGELHALHKTRAEFKSYLDSHQNIDEFTKFGLLKAEEILDRIEEEESF